METEIGCALTMHGHLTSSAMGRGAEGEPVILRGAKAMGNVASL